MQWHCIGNMMCFQYVMFTSYHHLQDEGMRAITTECCLSHAFLVIFFVCLLLRLSLNRMPSPHVLSIASLCKLATAYSDVVASAQNYVRPGSAPTGGGGGGGGGGSGVSERAGEPSR